MSLKIANSQLPFIQSGRFAKSLSSFNSETVFSFLEVGGVKREEGGSPKIANLNGLGH